LIAPEVLRIALCRISSHLADHRMPRYDPYNTNFDQFCFYQHPHRASLYLRTAAPCSFPSLRFFLLSVLLPASLGQTFHVHSPSHLELCASSSNGFFLVASESDFRVRLFRDPNLVHIIQPESLHCFLQSLSLLYRPTTLLRKMVHLQEDVGEKS